MADNQVIMCLAGLQKSNPPSLNNVRKKQMQVKNLGMRSAETQKKLRNFIKNIADFLPPCTHLQPPPTSHPCHFH